MVHDIDFLPDSYRQSQQRRKKTLWRRAVLFVVLAIIVAGTLHQRQSQKQVLQQRNRLQLQAELAWQQLDDPAALRAEIATLETQANVRTMLRMRTSQTRVLAVISACLPTYTSLTELQIGPQKVAAASSAVPKRGRAAGKKAPEETVSPTTADWKRLQKESAETELVVSLEGMAPNDLAISQFLEALKQSRSFSEVRLLYTDRHEYRETAMRAFGMQLKVRQIGQLAGTELPVINAGDKRPHRTNQPVAERPGEQVQQALVREGRSS